MHPKYNIVAGIVLLKIFPKLHTVYSKKATLKSEIASWLSQRSVYFNILPRLQINLTYDAKFLNITYIFITVCLGLA